MGSFFCFYLNAKVKETHSDLIKWYNMVKPNGIKKFCLVLTHSDMALSFDGQNVVLKKKIIFLLLI